MLPGSRCVASGRQTASTAPLLQAALPLAFAAWAAAAPPSQNPWRETPSTSTSERGTIRLATEEFSRVLSLWARIRCAALPVWGRSMSSPPIATPAPGRPRGVPPGSRVVMPCGVPYRDSYAGDAREPRSGTVGVPSAWSCLWPLASGSDPWPRRALGTGAWHRAPPSGRNPDELPRPGGFADYQRQPRQPPPQPPDHGQKHQLRQPPPKPRTRKHPWKRQSRDDGNRDGNPSEPSDSRCGHFPLPGRASRNMPLSHRQKGWLASGRYSKSAR
jgi:hypothetical protein